MNRPWGGLVGPLAWLAVAAIFTVAALQLDVGTPRRLGPGAFPLAAALLLGLLCVALALTAWTGSETAQRADWGPAIAIGLALAAFAVLTPLFGVLPGAFCATVAASLPDRALRWHGKLLLGLIVSGGVWLVFILGLRLPFTAFRGL